MVSSFRMHTHTHSIMILIWIERKFVGCAIAHSQLKLKQTMRAYDLNQKESVFQAHWI